MSHVYIITHFVYDFFFVQFTILMKNFPGSKKKKKKFNHFNGCFKNSCIKNLVIGHDSGFITLQSFVGI